MGRLDDWLAESLQRVGDPSRPTVTLSYAQSLDGSIALRRGQPLALSGPESQRMTHSLRARHEAILVGIGTVLSDDPHLSVRLVEGRSPQIVVLDSRLRMPLTARLLQAQPRIFCVGSADRDAQEELERAGAIVERQERETNRVDLRKMLARLSELGIRSLMVEGGGEVICSLLSEALVDRMVLTIAPQLVDGYRIPEQRFGGKALLVNVNAETYGNDLMIWGHVHQ